MRAIAKLAGMWLMLFCGLAQAAWLQFAETADADGIRLTYYDPVTVMRLPDGRLSVWEKDVRSPESAIAEREKFGLPTARFENFSHTVQRIIMDCGQRQYAVASIKDYSTYGEILDIIDKTPSEWHFNDTVHGSVTGILMKQVCGFNP